MPSVLMYSTRVCPYCVMAEKLLQKKIESLETELEKIKEELKKTEAERDKYWEKIGR